MNLDQIATKCFILALFIRDDGQRLLLGDGYYDFNQKLQHFQGNTIANDVVEIQGDNGQLLAGQVMRSGAQKFEGYIGDATTNRQTIEQKRSDFMAFFRIKHFYKVIYIFPDGTAIQRQRGYLTDAPTIPEIFQKFPEYSVALNFEDANYYEYAEDEHGDEIYAHIAELALAGEATGGLIWDAIGAVTNGITWSGIQTAQGEYISITNELSLEAPLASVEMLGNATQSGTPTPDNPQPISVVTGENVVKIEGSDNSQEYEVNLGSIELAKIGNYQDRIYKDSGKWYIEKQVGKVVFDGTEDGWLAEGGGAPYRMAMPDFFRPSPSTILAICDHFEPVPYNANWNNYTSLITTNATGSATAFKFRYTAITSLADWKSWLSAHPTTVYYALATPTTTEITNEALIAQLEALGASSLYVGLNNIGTETLNAVPTLKIEYYTEVDLDGAGYEWEPGGNTAKTIVTVAGVDSAWPIWTVQGGAQNPTLTNITTGQTISWQGFVPEGQTLTINMAEMTADLAGANVFEYITGEWIRLAPGNNTLVYNAGNADKPSTLSWNGVLA